MIRDAGNTEAAEAFQKSASNLQLSMAMTNGMIRKNRGADVDGDTLMEEVQQQTSVTMTFYTDRMKDNQLNTGEMWGQDELIKLDMEFCPQFPRMIGSDAWAETLMTKDWGFWDETFK